MNLEARDVRKSPTDCSYMGATPVFLSAWGLVEFQFNAGLGVKCYHAEHLTEGVRI